MTAWSNADIAVTNDNGSLVARTALMQVDEAVEIVIPGLENGLFGSRGLDHRPDLFEMSQRCLAQLQQQRHVSAHRLQARPAHHRAAAPAAPDFDELLRLEDSQRLAQRVP